jgi:hypothetical protein
MYSFSLSPLPPKNIKQDWKEEGQANNSIVIRKLFLIALLELVLLKSSLKLQH